MCVSVTSVTVHKCCDFACKHLCVVSWLHRASNNVETLLLPTDAHNVKKHRVIKF